MTDLKPVNLRTEYHVNPLGLDVTQPRLSWTLEMGVRGKHQSAYQILAASAKGILDKDQGDRWDTGKVRSNQSSQIPYGGVPLQSRMPCWWKVRVWDEDGKPGVYSAPACWTMGLLEANDWQARWIGHDEPFHVPEKGPEPLRLDGATWVAPEQEAAAGATVAFHKTMDAPANPIARARIVLSAGGQFTLFIDGREVGRSDGRFWACLRPQQFDITETLKTPGQHTFAVESVFAHCPAPGLIARILLDGGDGSAQTVETDASWKVAVAPEGAWREPGYDDSSWANAQEKSKADGPPWGTLCQAPLDIPPCPYLRSAFAVDEPVRWAFLYVTALGAYEMLLNGARVGDGLLRPGWSDWDKRIYYQTYDVAPLLREGDNALGAILGHGWYSGYIGWQMAHRGYYGDRPRLLAQLEIEYASGRRQIVTTGEDWLASYGPIIGADLYMGEQYDARRDLGEWAVPGYNAADWKPAATEPVAPQNLEAYPGVPVRAIMELTPRSVSEAAPGAWIFDLGQNIVGYVRLRVRGERGTKITLRFAESLDPATGQLYLENLRHARSIDEYWLSGQGDEVWEPRFTFHGFRFVEVTGYPDRPSLDAITGVVVHSDTPPTGALECSNPLVNQLQRNIQWGQRGNFLEVPTDCPQRDERLGWMGDAQVFARTACFNMDTAAFFTKWMQDVVDAQSGEGAFPNVAPRACAMGDGAPAWGDAGVIVPWTVYQCYGDTRILERCYDPMRRWIEYMHKDNPGLVRRKNLNDNYGDWLSNNANTPKELIATAYFAYSTGLMARIAEALGRKRDEKAFSDLRKDIAEAFAERFVDKEGRVEGDTQTGYVLALHFGLLPRDLRKAASAHLVERIKERDWHLSTGFVGCPYLLFALSDNGYLDVAYRLLLNETFPSWGYSICHGATTIWERWDGWTSERGFQNPGMNSFNHYAYGAVGEWLFRRMAGIDLLEPGYRRIEIAPLPGGGITSARASYTSAQGAIRSDWRIDGSHFVLTAAVPPNTRAEVRLPDGSKPSKVGPGEHVFTCHLA